MKLKMQRDIVNSETTMISLAVIGVLNLVAMYSAEKTAKTVNKYMTNIVIMCLLVVVIYLLFDTYSSLQVIDSHLSELEKEQVIFSNEIELLKSDSVNPENDLRLELMKVRVEMHELINSIENVSLNSDILLMLLIFFFISTTLTRRKK